MFPPARSASRARTVILRQFAPPVRSNAFRLTVPLPQAPAVKQFECSFGERSWNATTSRLERRQKALLRVIGPRLENTRGNPLHLILAVQFHLL
jgi:hypothetical protein